MKSTSSVKQQPEIIGPTAIVLYANEELVTASDEENGEKTTSYRYDFYRFTHSEYDNLKNAGILPAGASWDPMLRSIERAGMHEKADTLIAKANDYIECGSTKESEKWYAYRTALRSWKIAVRETKNQPGYPQKVEYPEMPSIH